MKLLLSLLAFTMLSHLAKAQSVVNAGGASISGGGVVLEYSIGEVAITTQLSTSFYGTQGLLQPTLKFTGPYCAIIDAPMQTFPNPVTDKFRLVGQYDWITGYHVYAADGRLVMAQPFFNNYIDLSLLPTAVYFVKLFPGCNLKHKVLKVMKQ
jgi:hypothetical protein